MVKLRQVFARTLVDIEASRVLKLDFDFERFINDRDLLCWLALEQGDIVPDLYVRTIDSALSELSAELSGLYQLAYQKAVDKFHRTKRYSIA